MAHLEQDNNGDNVIIWSYTISPLYIFMALFFQLSQVTFRLAYLRVEPHSQVPITESN
jgi:hypothetical protein